MRTEALDRLTKGDGLTALTADIIPPVKSGLCRSEALSVATREAMQASIARTALLGSGLIPNFDPETLRNENQRVKGKFSGGVRRLQIVGDDTVEFDHQPPVQLSHNGLDKLLGMLVDVRRMQPVGNYLAAGFGANNVDDHSVDTLLDTFDVLVSEIVGLHGRGIAGRHEDEEDGICIGMVDVVVEDLRHSPEYKEMLINVALEYFGDCLGKDRFDELDLSAPRLLEIASTARDRLKGKGRKVTKFERQLLSSLSKKIEAVQLPDNTIPEEEENEADEDTFGDELDQETKLFFTTLSGQRWREKARCKSPGLHQIFLTPDSPEIEEERAAREDCARSVCAVCPVQLPCLETALISKEVGVWGGTNEQERRRINKLRSRQSKALQS